MSLFRPTNITCPKCEAEFTFEAVGSVNADRRPDLREDILENRFQAGSCGVCGEEFRLQPEFNYLDAGNRLWLAAMPASAMPDYLAHEDTATMLFGKSYGQHAPAAAKTVGDTLDVRLTFGWPAVREKIFARVNGLDDVVLELMKLDLLRKLPSAPIAPGVELRLVGLTETDMIFLWLKTATEEALEMFRTPRSWYDLIAKDPEAWAPVRSRIDDGPFMDMQKTYMGPGRMGLAAAE